MRSETQIQAALRGIDNIADFARVHRLPRRTLVRVLAGGSARLGTLALIDAALNDPKPLKKTRRAMALEAA